MINKNAVQSWFANRGDYTHRLDYNLTSDSIVLDIGGYQGWFTNQIYNKFNCNILCFEPLKEYYEQIINNVPKSDKIQVYNYFVTSEDGERSIFLNGDATSAHVTTSNEIKCVAINLAKFLKEKNIGYIDLIKLNIEGEEYELVNHILDEGIKFKDLQVQFHTIEEYEEKYKLISDKLNENYKLTYYYPFVWENWTEK